MYCAAVTVKAYHLKWQELPLDTNIKKWSVHVLNLDRHKRHLDRATLNQFWEILDRCWPSVAAVNSVQLAAVLSIFATDRVCFLDLRTGSVQGSYRKS